MGRAPARLPKASAALRSRPSKRIGARHCLALLPHAILLHHGDAMRRLYMIQATSPVASAKTRETDLPKEGYFDAMTGMSRCCMLSAVAVCPGGAEFAPTSAIATSPAAKIKPTTAFAFSQRSKACWSSRDMRATLEWMNPFPIMETPDEVFQNMMLVKSATFCGAER